MANTLVAEAAFQSVLMKIATFINHSKVDRLGIQYFDYVGAELSNLDKQQAVEKAFQVEILFCLENCGALRLGSQYAWNFPDRIAGIQSYSCIS